jgi:hypothetical protein
MDTIESWTPLFSSIVTSTLWDESKEVRLLFVTMLGLKNKDGIVVATLSGLKRLSNLTLEETKEALKVLESPDTKTDEIQEFEGRRVEKCDRGWRILNHEKYRDLVQGIKRKAYQARWQKGYRERKNGTNPPSETQQEVTQNYPHSKPSICELCGWPTLRASENPDCPNHPK